MLLRNLSHSLVNGLTGKILILEEDGPSVQFEDQVVKTIVLWDSVQATNRDNRFCKNFTGQVLNKVQKFKILKLCK